MLYYLKTKLISVWTIIHTVSIQLLYLSLCYKCIFFQIMEQLCILCGGSLYSGEQIVIPQQKGRDTIHRVSTERGDSIVVAEGQAVHVCCRSSYTNKHNIAAYLRGKKDEDTAANLNQGLRSKNQPFDFRKCCLFCGMHAELVSKRGPTVLPVRTLDFQKTVYRICAERADEWPEKVKGKIEFVSDLPAADALYHQSCSTNFRTKRKLPKCFASDTDNKRPKQGRPVDEKRAEAFRKVVNYLQKNDTEVTIIDLIRKMKEFTGGDCYSHSKMKEELKKHFGDEIIITEMDGKANVVTFQRTTWSILHSFYSTPETTDEETQKDNIIRAAAELIKSDIKKINTSRKEYPSPDSTFSITANLDFVPKSLQTFLGEIFSGKDTDVKVASIGQAIMQAARPRILIAPLQIGLGVQMHHCFGSVLPWIQLLLQRSKDVRNECGCHPGDNRASHR